MTWLGVIGRLSLVMLVGVVGAVFAGCAAAANGVGASGSTDLVTDTNFLADIVRNIAGDQLTVSSLVPAGTDPHSFEPTPKDAQRVAKCRAVVINVKGLLPGVDGLVTGAGDPHKVVIEAAFGIPDLQKDPHCWLDPLLVVTYVDNIAQGLATLDPAGADAFRANAGSYVETLHQLDSWISAQVQTIPASRRLLVTNHQSLGRFAARYGFQIVGALIPSASGEGSPSARQLAELVAAIKATGAPATFVDAGDNTDLADQVGLEAGAKVVTDLYTHSLGKEASTYVEMMRWNVAKIVEALR